MTKIKNKRPDLAEKDWSPYALRSFKHDAGKGMSHTGLAEKYNITTPTVRAMKARHNVYVESRGRVYAPSEIRNLSKPEGDTSQRKERKCNLCGSSFTSEHFGNRRCGACDVSSNLNGICDQMACG